MHRTGHRFPVRLLFEPVVDRRGRLVAVHAAVRGERQPSEGPGSPTSQGVTETQQATNEIARMSTELAALVADFRY